MGSYSTFTPKAYTGLRPPRIDFTSPEAGGYLSGNFPQSMKAMIQGTSGKEANTLRPVQTLYTGLVANRAQGNDVGYDPSWLSSSTALAKNELGQVRDDRLRDNYGMLSASGLSGNPRAYEALAGRTQRDYSTDMENALSRMNIANMESKRADKNQATGWLGNLNTNNFGQENTAADFDLNQWKADNEIGLSAAKLNNQVAAYEQEQNDEFWNSLISGGAGIAGSALAGPLGGLAASSLSSAALKQGKRLNA